jgi:hypothetical protein
VAAVAIHRILGAIRDRIDVARGAADRVAGCHRKGHAEHKDCGNFLEHPSSPNLTACGNAAPPERLHYGRVLSGWPVNGRGNMRKAGLVLIALLSGCVPHQGIKLVRPLHPLEIATAPYQEVATTALTGTLMYEGGCLLFRDEGSHVLFMPVWPDGSSFNGNALLYHLPGKGDQWVAITQEVLLYGQPLQWNALHADTYLPIEHQCGAYPPYFVTQVRPAN